MMRRPAITLIEVLVSIFIMAIGLLALLVLFPLGALRMDQAIKADRSASAAIQATKLVSARNMRLDTLLYDPTVTPIRDVFADPSGTATGPWPEMVVTPGGYEGPSYPVFVDPIGVQAVRNQPLGELLGLSPGIPRRSVSFIQNTQQALRWFSLHDDIQFDQDGLPSSPGGQVQRSTRYTWSLLFRRPRANYPSMVEMAVVVYSSRPLFVGGGEPAYGPVTFDPASTSVLVTWDPSTGQTRPPVRKGGWVLDATVLNAAGQPDPRGYFYRVVNVIDVASAGGLSAVQLELETPPRVRTEQGVLVVLEYVTQVFDEGMGWKP